VIASHVVDLQRGSGSLARSRRGHVVMRTFEETS
jgi:hypothetical protein